MADEEDIRELSEGSLDMARRDLRQADLSNMDLSGRDFSGAHLEGAKLDGSDLSGSSMIRAQTSGMTAEGANFEGVEAGGTVIFRSNFRGANLRNSDFSRSHFTGSDLSGTQLEGANFEGAVFNEGTTFEGSSIDDATRFDGASIFRPLARQPAFKNYRVERGKLVRIEPEIGLAAVRSDIQPFPEESIGTRSEPQIRRDLVEGADAIIEGLAALSPPAAGELAHGGIGHNGPPEESPLERPEVNDLTVTLQELKKQVQSDAPDSTVFDHAQQRLQEAATKIVRWVANKADLAATEFAKGIGQTLGSKIGLFGSWLMLSGQMSDLFDRILKFSLLLLH